MAPPSWRIIPSMGPAIDCSSAGRAPAVAATTFSASGSISVCQEATVPSTHSARLQARAPLVPAGRVVTGSSQTSARRTASSTARASAAATVESPAWTPPAGPSRGPGPSSPGRCPGRRAAGRAAGRPPRGPSCCSRHPRRTGRRTGSPGRHRLRCHHLGWRRHRRPARAGRSRRGDRSRGTSGRMDGPWEETIAPGLPTRTPLLSSTVTARAGDRVLPRHRFALGAAAPTGAGRHHADRLGWWPHRWG